MPNTGNAFYARTVFLLFVLAELPLEGVVGALEGVGAGFGFLSAFHLPKTGICRETQLGEEGLLPCLGLGQRRQEVIHNARPSLKCILS